MERLFEMEGQLLLWIREVFASPVMDKIMIFISSLANKGMLWNGLSVSECSVPREQREWNQGRDIMALKEAGIEWKKDGLRHSYGTYMCAIEPNTSVVAKAMGNSVEILLKHYVQARTDKEGEGYFAIRPQNQQ